MAQETALTKGRLSFCLTNFARILGYLEAPRGVSGSNSGYKIDPIELRDELGRLRIWIGNIGGLRRGHGSLEYRLRDAPLVYTSVHKTINNLLEDLDGGEPPDLMSWWRILLTTCCSFRCCLRETRPFRETT